MDDDDVIHTKERIQRSADELQHHVHPGEEFVTVDYQYNTTDDNWHTAPQLTLYCRPFLL